MKWNVEKREHDDWWGSPKYFNFARYLAFKNKNKGKFDDKGDNSLSMIPEK